jgi:hypothetical protein
MFFNSFKAANGQGYGYSSDFSSNQQMKFGPGEISPDLEYEYEYYDLDETGISSITHIQQGQIKGHGQNKGKEILPDVDGTSTTRNLSNDQAKGNFHDLGGLINGDATYDEMIWKERVHIGHKEENSRSAEVNTYYKGKPSSPNGTKVANRVT